MSTFSGISGALSSLIAQRQALDVAGQNIANANTAGYTRQTLSVQAINASSVTALYSTSNGVGNGVQVVGINRIADMFLDSRLRSQTAYASSTDAAATALERLETVVTEPSDTGVASALTAFWSSWEDLANSPDSAAVRTTVLGQASSLANRISDTYTQFRSQWDQGRTEADTMAARVNTAAGAIADLNQQIRGVLVSGGSANELMDQRDLLVTELSGLVGATATTKADGTMTVMVAGNPLVQGDHATSIKVNGSYVMTTAIAEPASSGAISLSWADGTALALTGGALAGTVSSLQPASLGGSVAKAVGAVNDLATGVAAKVNALHVTGSTLAAAPDDTGVEFFTFSAGAPAALGLTVAITDPSKVAAAVSGAGEFDGSLADAISQLREDPTGPGATWRSFVVDLGVTTASARTRATVAESTRATAESLQLGNATVDIDEETANMLQYQTAYEAAARVLTTLDEMLDTLINRTGTVGR